MITVVRDINEGLQLLKIGIVGDLISEASRIGTSVTGTRKGRVLKLSLMLMEQNRGCNSRSLVEGTCDIERIVICCRLNGIDTILTDKIVKVLLAGSWRFHGTKHICLNLCYRSYVRIHWLEIYAMGHKLWPVTYQAIGIRL